MLDFSNYFTFLHQLVSSTRWKEVGWCFLFLHIFRRFATLMHGIPTFAPSFPVLLFMHKSGPGLGRRPCAWHQSRTRFDVTNRRIISGEPGDTSLKAMLKSKTASLREPVKHLHLLITQERVSGPNGAAPTLMNVRGY